MAKIPLAWVGVLSPTSLLRGAGAPGNVRLLKVRSGRDIAAHFEHVEHSQSNCPCHPGLWRQMSAYEQPVAFIGFNLSTLATSGSAPAHRRVLNAGSQVEDRQAECGSRSAARIKARVQWLQKASRPPDPARSEGGTTSCNGRVVQTYSCAGILTHKKPCNCNRTSLRLLVVSQAGRIEPCQKEGFPFHYLCPKLAGCHDLLVPPHGGPLLVRPSPRHDRMARGSSQIRADRFFLQALQHCGFGPWTPVACCCA